MEEIKKKIVFSVSNDLSFDQRMIRICSSLQASGFDVKLVGRLRKTSIPLSQQPFAQKRLRCWFDKGKLFYIEYHIRLFFYLLFTSTDIYGAIDADTLLPNTLVAIIKSRKLSYDAHEYFTEVPELESRPLMKWIWGSIEKICIPVAQIRYTVSPHLATIFSNLFKVHFEVVMNVPKIRNTGSSATINPFIMLYQGDLNMGRGIELAIQIMPQIDGELYIIGDGPMRAQFEAQIQQLNVSHKVKLFGYLNADQMHEVTSKASVGLNLLEAKGLSYYYSLSNKFFNYMQAGIPQICADFPEYQTINKTAQTALLCSYDANLLLEAIQQLQKDNSLYNQLKHNCIAASQRFVWEEEEKKLINLYRELGS